MAMQSFVKLACELFEARVTHQEWPPKLEGKRKIEYTIRQGAEGKVCHSQDPNRVWRNHTTRRSSYAWLISAGRGYVTLMQDGWLIRLKDCDASASFKGEDNVT
jgi:hypothetical protein